MPSIGLGELVITTSRNTQADAAFRPACMNSHTTSPLSSFPRNSRVNHAFLVHVVRLKRRLVITELMERCLCASLPANCIRYQEQFRLNRCRPLVYQHDGAPSSLSDQTGGRLKRPMSTTHVRETHLMVEHIIRHTFAPVSAFTPPGDAHHVRLGPTRNLRVQSQPERRHLPGPGLRFRSTIWSDHNASCVECVNTRYTVDYCHPSAHGSALKAPGPVLKPTAQSRSKVDE
jgi:hypothetical protein